ncbi:unnamed protein product [Darwinula stevensoni]|uniref:Membrane protein BRI3 n=1 Tax=Darwinula stevensoni TaxID=69355 RepID=A0A7R8X747_9CRUS|nr:unnamed protein product [Darwinula stevensoni]CAG0882801.1 unnamed protein product [Darwinula stevensoni]
MDGKPPPYAPEYPPPYNGPPPGFAPGPGMGPMAPQGPPGPATYGVPVASAPGITVVTTVGQCPTCHAGFLTDEFTCCGITMAVLFFPIGVLCCLAMRQKRCSNCGSTFS